MFERFGLMTWRSRAGAAAVIVGLVIGSVSAVGGAAPAAAAASPTGWAQIVSSGFSQTCGLTSGGAAWCWGGIGLGDATAVDSAVPVAMPGGHTFSQISGGVGFACGLEASTGAAWCWGDNTYATLGNGTRVGSSVPVAVFGGHTFSQISSGGSQTCALTSSGVAWCWGNTDVEIDNSVPVAVPGDHSWSQISSGLNNACGIEVGTGAAWCWGHGHDGELGNGTTVDSANPVLVSGDKTWSQVSVGAAFACGIEANTGAAWCWGYNGAGQFGNGTTDSSDIPVAASGGKTWSEVSSGFDRTCGIEVGSAAAWCWGSNEEGGLGAGDVGTGSGVPVAVTGGKTWTQLSSGFAHTCGMEAGTGAAWCWGSNNIGQLGNATTMDSDVPVPVSLIPQSVTFGVLSGVALPMGSVDVSGTVSASSGLAVTVSSSSPSVCTVSGMTVKLVAGGTCVLRASQPGDGAFAAAASVEQSFTVTPAPEPPTTVPTPEPVPAPPTTTPAPPVTTPTPTPISVATSPAPQAQVNPAATTPVPSTLATTGASIGPATGGAIMLIGLGAALIIMERRRTRRAN